MKKNNSSQTIQYMNGLLSRAKAQGGFTAEHLALADEICADTDAILAEADPEADAVRECFVNEVVEDRMADGFTYVGAVREAYADMVRLVRL
jgi:hypothetical protein